MIENGVIKQAHVLDDKLFTDAIPWTLRS